MEMVIKKCKHPFMKQISAQLKVCGEGVQLRDQVQRFETAGKDTDARLKKDPKNHVLEVIAKLMENYQKLVRAAEALDIGQASAGSGDSQAAWMEDSQAQAQAGDDDAPQAGDVPALDTDGSGDAMQAEDGTLSANYVASEYTFDYMFHVNLENEAVRDALALRCSELTTLGETFLRKAEDITLGYEAGSKHWWRAELPDKASLADVLMKGALTIAGLPGPAIKEFVDKLEEDQLWLGKCESY